MIYIGQGTFKKYKRHLNKLEKNIIPKATVTALNKTSRKLKTQAVREISTLSKIKQKVIRQRTRIFKATYRKQRGGVWVGTYHATYDSSLTDNQRGKIQGKKKLKFGKKTFTGVFKATMPNGKTDYFYRVTKKRLKIKKVSVSFKSEAQTVLSNLKKSFVPGELKKQFNYELKRRLNRAGY